MNELTIIDNQTIQNKIYTIRDVQVMVDRDLALLYGVETRALKQAVKRNIERFPEDFMSELIVSEIDYMVSQSVIPSNVLSSDIAIKIHIDIMRAFVNMRKFISQNASLLIKWT